MARRVYDIYLYVMPAYRRVLGKDRYTPLALQFPRVHYALHDGLIGSEYAALAQHLIYKRRFAVVNVRDNRYISEFFVLHARILLCFDGSNAIDFRRTAAPVYGITKLYDLTAVNARLLENKPRAGRHGNGHRPESRALDKYPPVL